MILCGKLSKQNQITRMHSSRMRTVRSSGRISGGGVPGPGGCTWSGGGAPGPGGVLGPRGRVYLVWGVYLIWGGKSGPRGVYPVRYSPPPVDRHTPVKT